MGALAILIIIVVAGIALLLIMRAVGSWMLRIDDVIEELREIRKQNKQLIELAQKSLHEEIVKGIK